MLHLTGTVPDLTGLRAHVATRLAGLPCLTHLLTVDGPTARWSPARPDMTQHIRAQRVGGQPAALDTAVRAFLHEPWPDTAPAWRMVLLHGHVPDGFALLYLTQHTVQDGANVVTVLEALFGPPLLPGQSSLLARGLTPTARPPLRQVLRSTATLLRHMRRHHLWQSPAHPPTDQRHTVWTQAPTAWLRAAARAGGASTNDVFLTALADAIAEWAGTAWPGAAGVAIPVMVPVSLRTPEEVGVPGNRLFLTRIDLPGGTMPPGERLERTRVVTAALKSSDHKAVLRAALTRLPRSLFQRLVALSTAPGRLTVCASYLVVRHRLHYGDAAVHRIDPIICCPPGVPMAVAVMSYEDVASACFRIDKALPHAETLPARWHQALADLRATTPPATDVGPARTEPATAADATSLVRTLVTSLVQRSTTAAARRK
ncbi:hypothetical protein [Kitasatospora atroaurantiaca]|uniref:hypothetical protein n=1 Tax=Kitasatospora atroaurantiaca TaxID=285545 RepID=UPI0014790475|nr:hypothetical protein [Kitasatospora atroaurantiaca]